MKRNTAAIRGEDNATGGAGAVHPGMGRTGQETGMRTGMVEAVNGVNVCFVCQQVGHISRNCPVKSGLVSSDPAEEAKRLAAESKRRQEDKNDFLSALREANTPQDASVTLKSVNTGITPGQPEAKAKKLPSFLGVKKRRVDDSKADKSDPPPDSKVEEKPGTVAPESKSKQTFESLEDSGASKSTGSALGGLGTYASSSEDEDEDEDEDGDD
eukprot:TRINITY_DN15138_c2_g1_i1.p1 TRINITY_DN15138_c2_g1~~TRINITY_DN15138_c2_g1_i1.p1  ORF type:complete len:213 (-),score=55.03 TRINITY_DN15138_c2_g1_i1:64-702(-)